MSYTPDTNFARVMLKSILQWFTDIDAPRANFIIDTTVNELPEAFQRQADDFGHVVMNLFWKATRDMTWDEEGVGFTCASGGFPYSVYILYSDILGFQTETGIVAFPFIDLPAVTHTKVDTSYQPKMQPFDVNGKEAKEVRANTEHHLKLIQNHRKPVVEEPVDPKNPSYPFPIDRFAEYNHKHKDRETNVSPQKDVIFHGTPGGIEFHSRKKQPRVRPSWMTVIDGEKK